MTAQILVTGGNGYVGRYVTRMLARKHAVCVADVLRHGPWAFERTERKQLRLEEIDIRDLPAVDALMRDLQPEIVIHLAACHYIPECERDPILAVSTNVVGTLNLLTRCPEGARFVFASSGAVYKPDRHPHSEDVSEVGPSDIYGYSKLHGEHYVEALGRQRSLAGVIVRLFNVIGPGETNPHLIPELVAQLKAGRNVIEIGNLEPKRDYIHVRDAAGGFVAAALGNSVNAGESISVNLGTSRAYSVGEVIAKLRRVSGINFAVRQSSERVRAVDRPYLAADIARMRSLFGWRPSWPIDAALRDLWREPNLAAGLVARYQ